MLRVVRNSTPAAWLLSALGAFGAFGALAACAGVRSAAAGRRPNVIVIMTDDQGFGDLGCAGNPVLETPNLDALAAVSARLTNFYVSPVCTPTRASLMTGRYAYRTRAIDTYLGRAMMDPGEATIAEILRGAGYRTAIFGKWHLGDCYPMRARDQGFEESLVLRGGGLAQPSEPRENARRYTDPILFRNGEQVRTRGFCTDVFFDAAIEFVQRDSEQPFFVYVAPNAPHTPLHDVPAELHAKYRDRDLTAVLPAGSDQADATARVFAMEENIDHNVGRLLAALDARGLAEDTIVIYLQDNGPQQARYNGGLRGLKGSVYEGGVRSPLFVRWPGRVAPGERAVGFGAHIDIAPTLYELAGVELPAGLDLDGESLAPVLRGEVDAPPERSFVTQAHRGDSPIAGHNVAVRGPRFKLVHATGFGAEAMPADVPWQLFDLATDPGETTDVAADHPDVVRALREHYERWFADVSRSRPDNYAPPRIVVGSFRAPETVLTRQDWRRVAAARPGSGSDGRWLLSFAGDGSYDLRVISARPLTAVRAVLTIGELRREQEVAGPTDTFVFEDVEVPAGNAALRVDLELIGDDRPAVRESAYQVRITAR
ncbi:MAG: arylsulfatase [Planctomycetes bacterium]|nr:arylsulfatase [Planctomycetota bacterium]